MEGLILITDTLCDANGVSRFIQDIAKVAKDKNKNFKVITSTNKIYCDRLDNMLIFKPIFEIKMPFYPELSLVLPPCLKIYKEIKKQKPKAIHISTPGSVGLCGLIIAKILKISVNSTYHTDFAEYIYANTKSKLLKSITRVYERFFYNRCKRVFLRSFVYKDLIANIFKIDKKRVFIIPPGIDIDRFDVNKRDKSYFEQFDIKKDATIALYVGRVTKEKNIEFLLDLWKSNYKDELNAYLVIIGSGYLTKYKDSYYYNIRFLGHRDKEELSIIYPSSDFFVFPSTTDTLGQVVIEAMANGLPVLVSDIGGPKTLIDILKPNGYILDSNNKEAWWSAIKRLIEDKTLREELSKNALTHSKKYTIANSFDYFYERNLI